MPDVEYRIVIEKNQGEGAGSKTTGQKANNGDSPAALQKTLYKFEATKAVAMKVYSGLSSRVGAMTGNVLLQNNINGAMNVAATALAFYANPLMGGVNAALGLAFQAIDRNVQTFWSNTAASEYRRRSGNYLSARSR